VALKVTLIALLARTERKRGNLALTLQAVCRRVLEVLDAAGILATAAEDRGVEIHWPSAIPENTAEKLDEAKMKLDLGVPRGVVLAELGYEDVVLDVPGSRQETKGAGDGQAGSGGSAEAGGGEQRSAAGGGGDAGRADAGEAGDGGVSEGAAP
jgi:hypothetical protein